MKSDRKAVLGAFREQQFERAEARKLLLRALAQSNVADGTISKLEFVELASRLGITEEELFSASSAPSLGGEPEPRTPLLGMALRARQEATFDGLVDDETVEEIVELCRDRTGMLGRLDNFGKSLVWTSSTMGQNQRLLVVRVARRNGQTSLLVEELNWPVLIGLWVGGGVGVGVGVGVPLTVALAAAGFAAIGSVLFASWILLVLFVIALIARSIGKGRAAVRRSITEGAITLIRKGVAQREEAASEESRARIAHGGARLAGATAGDLSAQTADAEAEAEPLTHSQRVR